MYTIIQDFAKIINSRISALFILYFFVILSILSAFMIGRSLTILESVPKVEIVSSGVVDSPSEDTVSNIQQKKVIFASSKGKYFYYTGCGGSTISKKNLVYYKSESEAIASGKVLYNKCK